ncbi:kinase-like domain, phloem protein 2-like protein [Tanacetum coccineum]
MASYLSGFEHLEIRLEEIQIATNNFDGSNVIGAGGFGKVYKGELLLSEGLTMVAFKHLHINHGQGDPEFLKEIQMLSTYRHENLISLLGFCKEPLILIYEYVSYGSLATHLRRPDLSWIQRLRICIGAARGLGFLHDPNGTQQIVLHRDIKSANILLDQNLNAKVADLGLSKLGPVNQQHSFLETKAVGTPGYMDPMYMETGNLTKESDVYSFGVVLFEVLCGRLCFERYNGQLGGQVSFWKNSYKSNKLEEIVSRDILGQISPDCLERFSKVAYQCLHDDRQERPPMALVLKELEIALELQVSIIILRIITITKRTLPSSQLGHS